MPDQEGTPKPAKRPNPVDSKPATPTLSPKTPVQSPKREFKRYVPINSDAIQRLDTAISSSDLGGAVVAIREVLTEVGNHFNGYSSVADSHAEGLEGHHHSLHAAAIAVKTINRRVKSLQQTTGDFENAAKNEVEHVKSRTTQIEAKITDFETRLDRVLNGMDVIGKETERIGKEAERSRNKIVNIEDVVERRFDSMGEDIREKISDTESFDTKVKSAIEQSLQDIAVGQQIMEMLSGGMKRHDEASTGIRKELDQTHEQLVQAATQLSAWEHNQRQAEEALRNMESTLLELKKGDISTVNAAKTSGGIFVPPPPGVAGTAGAHVPEPQSQ